MTPKAGRPKSEKPRRNVLKVRLDDEELEAVRTAAEAAKMDVSSFVRWKIVPVAEGVTMPELPGGDKLRAQKARLESGGFQQEYQVAPPAKLEPKIDPESIPGVKRATEIKPKVGGYTDDDFEKPSEDW